MNIGNKSLSKLSPIKLPHKNITTNNTSRFEDFSQIRSRQASKSKLEKSATRSSQSRASLNVSKSNKKPLRQQIQNVKKIEKQYTKSMYNRFQQKLNICTKIQDLISQIKDRQLKLKNYFEIYRILESQMGQQRCLEHNNDLSLYCQTENKVLCVHCVYGESKHKTHKVIPLKDCIKNVSKDVSHLQTTIKQDIEQIKIKIKVSQANQKFIERNFYQQLQELEKMYLQKLKEIETQFTQKKRYVNDYFHKIIRKNSELTSCLKQFEKDVQLKLTILNKDDLTSRQDLKQISKQTILSKIAQISNVKGIVLEDMDSKDIGQHTLRSRIKQQTKR